MPASAGSAAGGHASDCCEGESPSTSRTPWLQVFADAESAQPSADADLAQAFVVLCGRPGSGVVVPAGGALGRFGLHRAIGVFFGRLAEPAW